MTTYFSDPFTDSNGTALDAHVPYIGSGWFTDGPGLTIQANGLEGSNFLSVWGFTDDTIPVDDYLVSIIVTIVTSGWGNRSGVIGRSAPLFNIGDGYVADWNDNTGEFVLTLWSGGNPSVLGTWADAGFTSGYRVLALRMVGDEIALLVDNVERVVVTDATYGSGGQAGVLVWGGLGDGLPIDDFNVSDVSGVTPGVHVLTGRGNVELLGREWLSIALEDLPSGVTHGAAEPPNWYHVGMISWGSDNGAMTAYPVTRELDLVRIPPDMTVLHYEFAGGLTATITELVAP